MKKIFTLIMAAILGLLLFTACKKEELVVVNEPLELDENSPQYQEYMIERAINLIELFRFDKLGNTIDRIKDPAKKAEILAMLDEYRTRAKNEAWYYVTPENDTLYFFPPVEGSRLEAKNSLINFTPIFIQFAWQKQIVNVKGILHGMGIFPNLEDFSVINCLATGVKDVDQMPNLKSFSWTFLADYLPYFYPDLVLEPFPFEADFSKNTKLENLILEYADISKLKFPATRLKTFSLSTGIINENDALDGLSANNAGISAVAAKKDMALKAKNIDSLNLSAALTSLDISESNILKLEVNGVGKLNLNNGLKKLMVNAKDLKEKPNYPENLQELKLTQYAVNDIDFSSLTGLKSFTFDGSPFAQPGLKLPPNLEYINYFITTVDKMDLSHLTSLKTFVSYITTYNNGEVKLPASVETIDTYHLNFKGTFDISHLTNLKSIKMYMGENSKDMTTLILPVNLREETLKDPGNTIDGLYRSVTVVNKPAWFDNYVRYVD